MKTADLDILLQEGEGVMLEYKESLSSSFARELVGFANTAGGRILLGVRDDGAVKGIADSNALRARIQDIARNCDPHCPAPIFEENGFFTAIFHPNPEVRAQAGTKEAPSTAQPGTKKGPRRGQALAHDEAHEVEATPQAPTKHPASTPQVAGQVTGHVGTKLAPSKAHDASETTGQVPDKYPASTPQAPRKYPPNTPQVLAILKAAAAGGKKREELQAAAKIKDREHFRKRYLGALIAVELLERTIPDKPRSSKQRYRTTAAGRAVLESSRKETPS